jgi:hypothetical protein
VTGGRTLGARAVPGARPAPPDDIVGAMSMAAPFLPHGEPDPGVPAADPGAGAPRAAEGFGPEAEGPDRVPDGDAGTDAATAGGGTDAADAADADGLRPGTLDDPPFRTPDPGELQGR